MVNSSHLIVLMIVKTKILQKGTTDCLLKNSEQLNDGSKHETSYLMQINNYLHANTYREEKGNVSIRLSLHEKIDIQR